ncbi:MAG: hypothetical protein E7018_07180 [Alphaproteobacteria bacterium]|nr:hypothetical protein [Alphaproteobacteria bacterium]
MRKICFTLIFTFILFACASPIKYDSKLNNLVGANKATLIKEMGTPSAVKMLSDGSEVLAYVKANDVYVPSEFYLYNQGNPANQQDVYSPFLEDYDFSPYGAAFGYQVEYFCQTAFLLQNGVVTAWKWRGNDCKSY